MRFQACARTEIGVLEATDANVQPVRRSVRPYLAFAPIADIRLVIYDPLSGPGARTPFPGNVIPANRLDPWAMYLMQLYPLPNAAGSLNGTAGNNAFNGPGWQHNQEADFRVDHRFSGKDSIFSRVSYNLTNGVAADECAHATVKGPWNWSTMSPGTETRTIDPTCDLNGGVGILSGPYHSYAWNVVANWTRVQSSTLVTELKYSVTRPSTAAPS